MCFFSKGNMICWSYEGGNVLQQLIELKPLGPQSSVESLKYVAIMVLPDPWHQDAPSNK